jgi:hypothetical protein
MLLGVTLFNKCECEGPSKYAVIHVNNAGFDIYLGNKDGCPEMFFYPDTTISFNNKERLGCNKAQKYFYKDYGDPIETIIDEIPSDTLSVYYFHPDTLAKYSWLEIQQGYKILQRYDLSIEDIHLLYNKYGVPEIPYPPDERMKNMKMYPPYGTYNK